MSKVVDEFNRMYKNKDVPPLKKQKREPIPEDTVMPRTGRALPIKKARG